MPQKIRPADLEPDEIVGVVDHTHLIGFGVSHADAGDRRRERYRATEPREAPLAARLELARRTLRIGAVEDR